MVRPAELEAGIAASSSSCVELAGESPVAVSAGAPRSRLRAWREIDTPEWSVEGPHGAIPLPGGEQIRRPSITRILQPREIDNRKGEVAEPLISRRRQQTASENGSMQDASGAGRRACGDSSTRNRRDPSRRSTSDAGDPYKPKAKGERAGRESEGLVVLKTVAERRQEGRSPALVVDA